MSETPAPASLHDAHLSRLSMRVRVVRDVFEIIAFSAAGIWALWTFWYQASYEPAHEKPLIEWTVTLEREAVRPSDGLLAIRAHVIGSNKGKATEHLVSVVVNLSGNRVRRLDGGPPTIDPDAGTWDLNPSIGTGDGVFLASQGERWGDGFGAFVHPDQDQRHDFLFWIDPQDFDVLHADLTVRDTPDEEFARSYYQADLHDGGAVTVSNTEQCRQGHAHCRTGTYQTGAELPLWPAELGERSHVRWASSGGVGDGGAR